MYNALVESHVGGWEAGLVLLLVSYVLYRANKQKIAKIVHMVLRLMFVIIVVSGIWMLLQFHLTDGLYYVKGLLGIVTIGLMEKALGKAAGKQPSLSMLILAVVLLVIVVLVGYRVII